VPDRERDAFDGGLGEGRAVAPCLVPILDASEAFYSSCFWWWNVILSPSSR